MSILENKYPLSVVSNVTGVPAQSIKGYVHKGLLHSPDDAAIDAAIEGGGSPGLHKGYPFFSIMQILVARGILGEGRGDPKLAFKAALMFSHMSDQGRFPGLPYPIEMGDTYMIAGDGWSGVVAAQEALPLDLMPHGARQGRFVVVPINPIFDRAVAALGEHPQKVMDDLYEGANLRSAGYAGKQ